MEKHFLILIIILLEFQLIGQNETNCFPRDLIVAAENLNFRYGPNLNSEVICKLDNSERLTLLEFQTGKNKVYWNSFESLWLKVRRNQTNEIGYVLGNYVKTPEMAYLNYQDCDRIQSGNWYALYKVDKKIKIEKTEPKVIKEREFFMISGNDDKYQIFICSQEKIKEGEIKGYLFDDEDINLKIGVNKLIGSIKGYEFRILCTGEVELVPPMLIRKNEKIIFLKTKIEGSNRQYSQQDITNCVSQFGENGYYIHFAGDLNDDGIPELILSEGSSQGVNVYYFRSNQEGNLELVSVTSVTDKC